MLVRINNDGVPPLRMAKHLPFYFFLVGLSFFYSNMSTNHEGENLLHLA